MHIRSWFIAAAAAGAALLGLWLARAPAITAADAEQPRLSQPAPIPIPGANLVQTLRAQHNGLSGLELLGVYYGGADDPPATLTLRLFGPGEQLVGEATHTAFEHNQPLRLAFAPVPDSAGQTYRLEISGAEAAQSTVWAYHLDGYADGNLHLGNAGVPGDLRFAASYTYLWADLLSDLGAGAARLGRLILPLWLVLFAPGLLVLRVLRPSVLEGSRWVRWGGALALSLAGLPLAWLWTTTLGLAWSRVALGAVYAAAGGVVAGRWMLSVARVGLRKYGRVRAVARPGQAPVPVQFVPAAPAPQFDWHDAALALLLLASLALRLVAVRDLALPAWVDSSHHAFIAGLLGQTGRVPTACVPLPNYGLFTYHFGVHTLLAALDWFSGLALPDTMLLAGQVLNGLMPLAIYAGARGLTGSRRAALLAAVWVGVISFFPGYYVTWGRYSQLAGLLLLPPAMAAAWALLAGPPTRSLGSPVSWKAFPWGGVGLCGLLAVGLLLAHYRVFFFFVAFVVVALVVHVRRVGQGGPSLAVASAVGGLLALPWLLRLLVAAVLPLASQPGRLAIADSYNAFPTGYFASALEQGALGLAGLFGLWGLSRRDKVVWALLLWVGGLFALLNLGAATWLVNNNAWAISLFVPVALLLGWGVDRGLSLAAGLLAPAPVEPTTRWRRGTRFVAGMVLVAAAAGVGAYALRAGPRAQVAMVNPVTVLAQPEDRAALDWVAGNTPPEAVFVVNGWNWLGAGWAGADGGAWLMPLTGRRATLPPVTYSFGGRPLVVAVQALAQEVAAIEDADAPATLDLLRAQGVTHVFIGARGGNLKPEMFTGSSHYRLLYTNGAAWVFELVNPGPPSARPTCAPDAL